jgi:hypothetical protein
VVCSRDRALVATSQLVCFPVNPSAPFAPWRLFFLWSQSHKYCAKTEKAVGLSIVTSVWIVLFIYICRCNSGENKYLWYFLPEWDIIAWDMPRRISRLRLSGVDVMITIFSEFCQFSPKKLAFFSKTNVMIKILHNLALFWVKNANFIAEFFGENI